MVKLQPSKLVMPVRFRSTAHLSIMNKIKYLLSFLIPIYIISCGIFTEDKETKQREFQNYMIQGDALYNNNDYTKALAYYIKAEDINSKNGNLLYRIGFCYDKGEKDLSKAEKYYLKSLKYLDINMDIHLVAATYFNLGVIAMKRGDNEKKYENFISAYSLLTKLEDMGKADGLDYFRLGYYYMDKKDEPNAIKYFLKAIEDLKNKNPKHFYYSGAYFNIGIIYWNRKEIKTTLKYWKKALDIDPENQLYLEWYNKALEISE